MNEMLQKVGGAILIADLEWTPKSPMSREETLARAAIEAMREPTKSMIAAGAKGSGEDSDDVALGAWEGMIDSALTKS